MPEGDHSLEILSRERAAWRSLRGELNAREELLLCEVDCMKTESLCGNVNAGEELLPWRAVRLTQSISAVREEPIVMLWPECESP